MSHSLPQKIQPFQIKYRSDKSKPKPIPKKTNNEPIAIKIQVNCVNKAASEERLKRKILESQKQRIFKLNLSTLDAIH